MIDLDKIDLRDYEIIFKALPESPKNKDAGYQVRATYKNDQWNVKFIND